jgi:hypothetical protein
MVNVVFDEEKSRSHYGNRGSRMSRLMIRSGFAKTPQQVRVILLIFVLILFAISFYIFPRNDQRTPAPGELPPVSPETRNN